MANEQQKAIVKALCNFATPTEIEDMILVMQGYILDNEPKFAPLTSENVNSRFPQTERKGDDDWTSYASTQGENYDPEVQAFVAGHAVTLTSVKKVVAAKLRGPGGCLECFRDRHDNFRACHGCVNSMVIKKKSDPHFLEAVQAQHASYQNRSAKRAANRPVHRVRRTPAATRAATPAATVSNATTPCRYGTSCYRNGCPYQHLPAPRVSNQYMS